MVDQYTIAWRMMLVLLWDTCHKILHFTKNNTDFNIANWAKHNIKILTIKTRYMVFLVSLLFVAVINPYSVFFTFTF